jgi:hypothetical protein
MQKKPLVTDAEFEVITGHRPDEAVTNRFPSPGLWHYAFWALYLAVSAKVVLDDQSMALGMILLAGIAWPFLRGMSWLHWILQQRSTDEEVAVATAKIKARYRTIRGRSSRER